MHRTGLPCRRRSSPSRPQSSAVLPARAAGRKEPTGGGHEPQGERRSAYNGPPRPLEVRHSPRPPPYAPARAGVLPLAGAGGGVEAGVVEPDAGAALLAGGVPPEAAAAPLPGLAAF